MHMVRFATMVAIMIALAGCSSATRSVTFRVVDLREGGEWPLAGALVRVIPMEVGMVPLPVTKRTLSESAYGEARTVVVSDRDGYVRLDVLGDRAAWIEVERAPVGAGAERRDEVGQVWRWRWDPATGAVSAVEESGAWTVGLQRGR